MLEFALMYLRQGLSIIPVGLGDEGKAPYLPSWMPYCDRRPTEDEVREWWTKWPDAKIGMICGAISGRTVLDVDYNEKGNVSSGLAFHDDFPKTKIAKTGSGGLHYHYQYCKEADGIKNLRPKIDIKSHHGFVILPPSGHVSGGSYQWVDLSDPQPFPTNLLRGRLPEAQKAPIRDILFGVGHGSRNNAAASLVGICASNKLSPEDAFKFLQVWNIQCDPPLPDRELATVVNSIYKTHQRNHPEDKATRLIHLADASELHKKEFSGIFFPTGFNIFDTALKGGIKVGDLGVVTGHSGHGKSTLAQAITIPILKAKHKVVWFQFEMMPTEFWEKFEEMGVTKDDVLLVPDNYDSGGALEWIDARVKEGVSLGVHIYFIDLLDFLKPRFDDDKKRVSQNQASYITLICEQLKSIAKTNKVAIVLMAHTRKPQQGKNQQPNEFDLKDSGGILQHSDWLMIIHRLNNGDAEKAIGNPPTKEEKIQKLEDMFRDTEDSPYSIVRMRKNRRTGIKPSIIVKFEDGVLREYNELAQSKVELVLPHTTDDF